MDKLISFIDSLNIPYTTNEYGIFFESHSLAITLVDIDKESSFQRSTDLDTKKKFVSLSKEAQSKGIHLLIIYSNEWESDVLSKIWKSMIKHRLNLSKKIYARKCHVKEIDGKTANVFCKENHLQGSKGGSLYLGLFHGETLLQVAILGKSRYNKDINLELMRFCTLVDHCVVGGASKLLKPYSFISYGNKRWCDSGNNVYNNMADLIYTAEPCYYYLKDGKIYHRSSFMKHKLKDKLEVYNPSMTEVENCYNNGMKRIWDVGCVVYVKHNNNDIHFEPKRK